MDSQAWADLGLRSVETWVGPWSSGGLGGARPDDYSAGGLDQHYLELGEVREICLAVEPTSRVLYSYSASSLDSHDLRVGGGRSGDDLSLYPSLCPHLDPFLYPGLWLGW